MAKRICISLLVFGLLAAAAAALPPHADHHPRLLFAGEEIPELLTGIEADPRRLAVWEETLATAADLVQLEPDSLLSYYWGFQEIEELALVARLADAPLATQAEQAIEAALLHLIAVADPTPDPDLGVLGTAMRLHALSWGYDHAFSAAPDSIREQVVDEILVYTEAMTQSSAFLQFLYNPLLSNKSLTLGAQLVLASLLLTEDLPGDPRLAEARQVGEALMDKAWADLYGAAGSYREGIGYMVWSLRTLLPTWEALRRLEGDQPLQGPRAAALLQWLAYQLLPGGQGRYLNRNESNSGDFLVSRHHSLLEWSSCRGEDPDFARWLLRRSSGDLGHDFGRESDPVATILWHRSGPEASPSDWPAERYFPDRGLYLYRQGWPGDPPAESFLFSLEGGRFMGGHAQEDVGQFTMRALGHGFALDHGAGIPARQTEGHNLPSAAGRGQHNAGASIGTDGETRLLLSTPFCSALCVDMRQAYTTHSPFNDPDVPWAGWDWSWGYDGGNPMLRAERTLLLFPPWELGGLPELYLEDSLLREEPGEHYFRWRLHLDTDLAVGELGGGLWSAAGAGGELRLFLHDPPRANVGTSMTTFDNQNIDPDAQVLHVGQTTEAFRFLWQLSPLAPGAEPPLYDTERLSAGLRLVSTRGGRERILLRCDQGDSLAVGDELLVGDWGVIERAGSERRTMLLKGRRLRGEGKALIGLEPAGSAAWDGERVHLSSPELDFKIWAPGALQVLAQGLSLPFERRGEFVLSPGMGEAELPNIAAQEPPMQADWPAPGGAPLRIRLLAAPVAPLVLALFDVQGRRVRELRVERGARPEILWDGLDSRGHPAASGVYLALLSGGEGRVGGKLLLLR